MFRALAAFIVIGGSFYALSSDVSLPAMPKAITQTASVVTSTEEKLPRPKAENNKIRVFIMPGHEPDFGGSQFKTTIERDINVEISLKLQEYLEFDGKFEVVVGRSKEAWHPELQTYFDEHLNDIKTWRDEQAAIMKDRIADGDIDLVDDPIAHEHVSGDVATRLYGVNKWVGENDFDVAVHVHINDYGGRGKNRAGEFVGYAIYVPESQYDNAALSKEIAMAVQGRFLRFFSPSNAKRERAGVVEDQQLVALGRYNTAKAPSILIEYAYLYESQLTDKATRELAVDEYAFQTYLGLKDYFFNMKEDSSMRTAALPYEWNKTISESLTQSPDIYALQIILRQMGFYPIERKTLSDCPISGLFGSCTQKALTAFQVKYKIKDEEGILGEKTREKLNDLGR